MESQSGDQRAHSGYVDDLEYARALMVRSDVKVCPMDKVLVTEKAIIAAEHIRTYVCMYVHVTAQCYIYVYKNGKSCIMLRMTAGHVRILHMCVHMYLIPVILILRSLLQLPMYLILKKLILSSWAYLANRKSTLYPQTGL